MKSIPSMTVQIMLAVIVTVVVVFGISSVIETNIAIKLLLLVVLLSVVLYIALRLLVDITDRRHAEELVERSEEKFARAFRSSPVGLAVTRLSDGVFIEVNLAAAAFLGYGEDELIGRSTIDLALWPNFPDRQVLIDEIKQHGSVRGKEISFRTKQGNFAVCEYSAELIEVAGEPCVLSVILDITERRYMERALEANEELLRLFVKHTPAAIAMFDTEMRYLQVSDRFLTDYHLEGQEIIGKLHYDVFPNLPDRWKAAHRRILAGAVEHSDEEPYEQADGTQGWLQWESLPWRKPDGEIGGLILFTQVITERKRAEQALRASEERFAKIFNLSPYRMGILRISDGVILDVNECWVNETGFSREETVNHVIYDLDQWLTEDSRIAVRKVLAERQPVRGLEGVLKTKTGQTRYALSSAAIVDFDGEPCYLWAANDITDRKLGEEEKRRLIHDLGERVKELTALHRAARILQDETQGPAQLLQNIVSLLPPAWQYPEVTAARIKFGEMEFKTPNFATTCWSQVGQFSAGNLRGEIEVVYLMERPPEDIGPFLFEEQNLINSLAEMIGSALNRRYSEEQLRALSARMQSAREEEGTRIAREIHDELGGSLTGIKWDLEGIDTRLSTANGGSTIPEVRKQIKAMTGLIESTIDTVRRISSELRPGVLDDLGLVAAIEWQAQQFQKRTGLLVHWDTALETAEVSRDRATAVFRIFQEVLTNVLRHSQATNIYIRLRKRRDQLELEVVDDGRGITEDEQKNTLSLGLLGMKERALLVGGAVSITGAKGKGTTVVVSVPLSEGSESEAVA
jgi:PAS domain S-box-containing protein